MQRFVIALLPERNFPPLIRYGGAAGVIVLALFVHEALRDQLVGYPVLLFFPAVFLAALLFDWGAGLFATFLAVPLAAYLFVEPAFSLRIELRHVVPLGIFTLTCCALALATGALRDAVQQLAQAEARQSLLLDELTHRIKNDLMMVTSVLSLQAKAEADPAARNALESAIGRISAVARAHERLREGGGEQEVPLAGYVETLCRGVTELLRDIRPIAVTVRAQPCDVSARQAISIGLIVNELLTNALKYAFPPGTGGTIVVDVTPRGEELEIHVRDDGVGCPVAAHPGLGSRLVRLLAAQMGGTVDRQMGGDGCHVLVRVPLERPCEPVGSAARRAADGVTGPV